MNASLEKCHAFLIDVLFICVSVKIVSVVFELKKKLTVDATKPIFYCKFETHIANINITPQSVRFLTSHAIRSR